MEELDPLTFRLKLRISTKALIFQLNQTSKFSIFAYGSENILMGVCMF